jgi:hypothetical protein
VLVRERFEKTKMATRYFSESMLQNCSDLYEDEKFRQFLIVNADAVIDIEVQQGQFELAIEYEISSKQAGRYFTKIRDYYYLLDIECVLYICGNASIEKLIRKADAEVRGEKQSKIFTCLEETFHKSEMFLSFESSENQIVKIS